MCCAALGSASRGRGTLVGGLEELRDVDGLALSVAFVLDSGRGLDHEGGRLDGVVLS
jgi:hypothetical protein